MKKKKIILAFLAFLPFSSALAQVGEIIYRDFEPDSILIYWHKLGPVWIDLDVDGESDDLEMVMHAGGEICYPEIITAGSNVKICAIEKSDTTLILSEVDEEDWKHYIGWSGGSMAAYYSRYGFRIQREDGYYYGWFETYNRVVSEKNEKHIAHYGFDRTAYCTIPNYPLKWGQTSTGIEENDDSSAFAVLHPNPTSGLITIIGENLRQVEVVNVLGQQMLSVQGKGDELHIDMTAQPVGIYFVNITDESGHKCVRKVVKE